MTTPRTGLKIILEIPTTHETLHILSRLTDVLDSALKPLGAEVTARETTEYPLDLTDPCCPACKAPVTSLVYVEDTGKWWSVMSCTPERLVMNGSYDTDDEGWNSRLECTKCSSIIAPPDIDADFV